MLRAGGDLPCREAARAERAELRWATILAGLVPSAGKQSPELRSLRMSRRVFCARTVLRHGCPRGRQLASIRGGPAMRTTALTLTLLVAASVCGSPAGPAQAQPTRVFVAAQGSDGNPCTF